MKFKFGDKVTVKDKFYSNHVGTVQNWMVYEKSYGYDIEFIDGETKNLTWAKEEDTELAHETYTRGSVAANPIEKKADSANIYAPGSDDY